MAADDDQPVTEGDLRQLEKRIDGDLRQLEKRIDGDLREFEKRIDGDLRALEERLAIGLTNVVRKVVRDETQHAVAVQAEQFRTWLWRRR